MKTYLLITSLLSLLLLTSCNNTVETVKPITPSTTSAVGSTIEDAVKVEENAQSSFTWETVQTKPLSNWITVTLITTNEDENVKNMSEDLLKRVQWEKFLSWATFNKVLIEDDKTSLANQLNEKYGIDRLPIIMLNTNQLDDNWQMSDYLVNLWWDDYFLILGSKYNFISKKVELESKWIIEKTFEANKKETK